MALCDMNLAHIRNDCLETINSYRKRHNLAPLIYEHQLESSAIVWAQVLARIAKNSSSPDSGVYYGENIAIKHRAINNLTGCEIATIWYAGVHDYKYNSENAIITHCNFTQLIWASTREFGLGVLINDEGDAYVVGRFRPTGNIPGVFKFNVFPPCSLYKPLQPSLQEMNILTLNHHNMLRRNHGVPPLTLCHDLVASAQIWAETIAPLNGKVSYSHICSVGENIGHIFNPLGQISGRKATMSWYKTGRHYDYENPPTGTTLGTIDPFAQIIWKNTIFVGFGRATHKGHHYIVAHYRPAAQLIDFENNINRVVF